jgi:hypothetical protein
MVGYGEKGLKLNTVFSVTGIRRRLDGPPRKSIKISKKGGNMEEHPLCWCEHEYEAHLWNISQNPEFEDLESGECRECGSWTRKDKFETHCSEYKAYDPVK